MVSHEYFDTGNPNAPFKVRALSLDTPGLTMGSLPRVLPHFQSDLSTLLRWPFRLEAGWPWCQILGLGEGSEHLYMIEAGYSL